MRAVAVLASGCALIAGVVTLTYLLTAAGPITLCSLWPPTHCISGQLSGMQYFTGDSQAAPVWHVTFNLVLPLLALGAACLHARRRFPSALSLAALACMPSLVLMFDTYAVMPFHALVAGGVWLTFIAVTIGTTRAVWAPKPDAPSA